MKHLHRIILICITLVFIITGCATDPGQTTQKPNIETNSSHEVPNVKETESPTPVTEEQLKLPIEGELVVHFIDVGQGASQLIIGPTGRVMLIDAGNNDKEKLIVEYMQKENIERIDILIGTHPDADHIGGLDAVINNFDIGQVYMPRIQANTKTFEDVLLAVQKKGLKISTAKAGLELNWEDSVQANMIAPIGEYSDTNEMSAVVRLTFGETSFLLTGDAESKSEADMVASGSDLKADVLLVSHHGSKTSTNQEFLDLVDPRYAVIQSGAGNKYGHPTDEVLERLEAKEIEIYRNDQRGNIIFNSDGKNLSATTDDWTPEKKESVPSPAPRQQTEPVQVEPPKEDKAESITVTASIDNEAPKQNASVTVTVTVTDQDGRPVQGAQVDLSLKYKSTTTNYDGITDATGTAKISFKIGRAAKEYKVNGNLTVSHDGKTATTQTSFTPQ